VVAWLRRRRRRRGQFTGDRPLDVAALIKDRGSDRFQADFTVLTSVKRMGLLVRTELVPIH
jgi:hypothetical protein